MKLVKDELGDGRVGVGISGEEQGGDWEVEEGRGAVVVEEVSVVPRMSSM